jgi:hypothetical protein
METEVFLTGLELFEFVAGLAVWLCVGPVQSLLGTIPLRATRSARGMNAVAH